jgi:mannose-6-phosphate isomerase-like protein (cupin superfamily)
MTSNIPSTITTDQFFRIEHGSAKATVAGKKFELSAGDSIIVPAGVRHNIVNPSREEKLKLYTVYSPAVHKDGTVQKLKPAND